jgi:hypothetical protein
MLRTATMRAKDTLDQAFDVIAQLSSDDGAHVSTIE